MSDTEPVQPESYEAAAERLEKIIERLDAGEAGLGETLQLCREGKTLVEYCVGELDAVGEALKELRLEDLVARLEAAPRAHPDSAPSENR